MNRTALENDTQCRSPSRYVAPHCADLSHNRFSRGTVSMGLAVPERLHSWRKQTLDDRPRKRAAQMAQSNTAGVAHAAKTSSQPTAAPESNPSQTVATLIQILATPATIAITATSEPKLAFTSTSLRSDELSACRIRAATTIKWPCAASSCRPAT